MMKPGVPWNLKGIDEEARQAAMEAARHAGVPLHEWLNRAIATRAAEEGVDPEIFAGEDRDQDEDGDRDDDEFRNVASSIAELTRRIRAMDVSSRAAISGLKDRLDEIEDKLGRADQGGADDHRRTQSLKGVSVLVDKLAREIDTADESARTTVEGRRSRFGGGTVPEASDHVGDAIRALEQRLAGIAERIKPPQPPATAKLDDLKTRLDSLLARAEPAAVAPGRSAAIDSTLKALEGRLDEARARATTAPPAKPRTAMAEEDSERVRRIESRLADISGRLAEPEPVARRTPAPAPSLEAAAKPEPEAVKPDALRRLTDLAGAIAEISAHQQKLDQREDTLVLQREQKRLGDGIGAIRADLAALADKVAAATRSEAEGREAFFGLSRKIDALAAEKPVERGVLGEIRREIDGLRANSAREATVLDRFNDLGRKVPDRARLDALGEEVSALRRALENSDNPRAVARVEMRVNELARSVESVINSRQATVDASAAAMTAGLAEIHQAIAALGEQARNAERESHQAVVEASAAAMAKGVADIRQAIAALSERARHAERESRQAAIEASSTTMAAGLAEIRQAMAALGERGRHPERDAAIAGLPTSIDEIRRAIAELSALARRGDSDTTSKSINALLARLDEVGRGIDQHADEQRRAEETAVQRLEGRLDEIAARIDGVIDRAAPVDVVNGLHDRLEALAERLDHFNITSSQPGVFDELKAEIAGIRRTITSREPPRTDNLERQIRELAERLEEVSRPDSTAAQLAVLEGQIGRLSEELERTQPRSSALAEVEADLARLQAHLSDNRQESVEAARRAARDAVRELAGTEAGSDLIRALKDDLERIRSAAGDSDQRSRETLQALHGTLAAVIERLGRLEEETRGSMAMESPAATTGGPRQPVIPRAEPAAAPAAPPADQPLEPGSGKPDLEALRGLASGESGRERAASERRADFIAAARRAAQAAMAEAGSAGRSTDDKPDERPRGGTLARIGQAIRSRKKPLLLAAAAIVLAIGALQLFGLSHGTGRSTAVAKIEPPPASLAQPAKTRDFVASAGEVPAAAASVPKDGASGLVSSPPDARAAIDMPGSDQTAGHFADAPVAPAPDAFADGDAGKAPPAQSAAPAAAAPAPATADNAAGTDSVDPTPTGAIGSDKLKRAAAAGDPAAAFEIATRYAEGRGVAQNLATAADWYKRAADGGVAVAQYRLGSLYERGQGVKKDLSAAVNWYQRAADQGNVGAMHNLAVLMSEGIDGAPDYAKALQWFLAAADYGVKDSQYNLGVIYARGIGTARDLVESYKWFAIAAAQGDSDAAARRDEVAGMLNADQLAKARAVAQAWKAKTPIAEANGVSPPAGGWDEGNAAARVTEADRKALVKKIQELLAGRGYDPGPADGVEGRKTREAVKAFQHTIGVADTGAIDKSLVAALTGPQR
jgi:localization factor PodJL